MVVSCAFAFGLKDVGEEVVAFVVDDDDGGEVDDVDFANGFHAEFFEVDEFDGGNIFFGEEGGGSADGAEVEAAVFAAGFGDLGGAVAFGEHDHRAAMLHEAVDVGVHALGGGGTEGAGGFSGGGFGGAGVVYGMVFEVVGHGFAVVEHLLDAGVGDVAGDDEGAVEAEAGADGVLGEFLE